MNSTTKAVPPGKLRRIAQATMLAACAPAMAAPTINLGDEATLDFNATINYGVAMRTKSPGAALVNGPIGAAGLPSTINADDGDRNFKRHSLTENRISALLEGDLKYRNLGLFARASMFYDNVYNRRNDNNVPSTVNHAGDPQSFTEGARDYAGRRARMLDVYAYGAFTPGDTKLNLRAGQQVVQWGEALYFPNIAGAQAPADATKSNVAGAEVKDILLPTGQVSAQWAITPSFSAMAYYQYKYKPTEVSPAGTYFSYADMIGPGADRIYTMANPLLANPATAALPGLPMMLAALRGPDIRPSDRGQFGVGVRFRPEAGTELGLYYLRYHDKNPTVQMNFGFATLYPGLPQAGIPAITSAALPPAFQFLPTTYQVKYFDGIHLAGATFSTQVAGISLAGELSRRSGAPVLVNTPAGPTSSRSTSWQGQISAIKAMEKTPLADSMILVAEVGMHRVSSVDALTIAGAQYSQLAATRSSWGYVVGPTLSYQNVFGGWDMDMPITFQHLVRGVPAVAGSFGALTGKGDKRMSVGVTFRYLSNLEVGAAYNAFLGGADAALRPLGDRNYLSFNVKYRF
ncbi:DUF1302 family protein [Duganella sp. FT92W]|uniref:DUF1302 family protein n=1 Tax=Pseudoduganella rivuli TaxID=2666085 RepID=A0A7X2IM50_9BURK|nr:DUF1302 domain-containing protein [Pseudoduganella rivuli]MRV72097.1 DUF1302 family protein [Pseudoduganella rivuli]